MAKPAAKQKIAIVAAEMTPYAKVGGLADVIGSVPLALAAEGAEVCVVLPGYRSALRKLRSEPVGKAMSVEVGPEPQPFTVRRAMHGDVSVYLLDHPGYFDRDGVYGELRDYPGKCQTTRITRQIPGTVPTETAIRLGALGNNVKLRA